MSLKSIPLSIKALFFAAIVGLVILYFLPTDEFGTKCGGESFIPFVVILSIILIPLVVLIIDRARKRISNLVFFGILILLILMFLIIGLNFLGGNRCCPVWRAAIAEMHQLSTAQKIFYEKDNRYADTQEELMGAGILSDKFKDRHTGKELTDKDGKGIEGSDNNPNTWSAITYIYRFDKWCRLVSKEYFCNQDGCHEE